MRKKLLYIAGLQVFVVAAFFLLFPAGSQAQAIPISSDYFTKSYRGPGWPWAPDGNCNGYPAAQDTRISRPPTRTSGSLDFRNQAIPTITPGGTLNMELIDWVTTCNPGAGSYPEVTASLLRGVSINRGASIVNSASLRNRIHGTAFTGDRNRAIASRIPVTIRFPSNLSGAQAFTISFDFGGKINRRKPAVNPRYQCVSYRAGAPRNRETNFNTVSNYANCLDGRIEFVVHVNLQPPAPNVTGSMGCHPNGNGYIRARATRAGQTYNYRVQRWVNGGWQDVSGLGYGSSNQASGAQQEFNISQYTSQGRYGFRVRIREAATNREFFTSGADVGRCAQWNHVYKAFSTNVDSVSVPVNTPIPANLPQHPPGTSVQLTSRLRNEGGARGPTFDQYIEYKLGGEPWRTISPVAQHTEFPADPGGSGQHDKSIQRTYAIPGNTAAGTVVCFRARINDFTGVSNNGARTVTSGSAWRYVGNTTTAPGTTRCLRVEGESIVGQPSCTMTPNPSVVDQGGTSRLTWTSQNAVSAQLTGPGLPDGGEAVAVNGSRDVTITNPDARYTLEVTNDSGARRQCPAEVAMRHNRPFLRVEGSDVIAGAVFADEATTCEAARAAYPDDKGYIKANGNPPETKVNPFNLNPAGFSSAEYAAFAFGNIGSTGRNNFGANNGYVWGSGSGIRDVLFANNNVEDQGYGHYFDQNKGSLPCLDTADLEQQARNRTVGSITDALAAATASPNETVYVTYSGSDLTLGATTIQSGQRIVLVVPGKLTLTGDITFGEVIASGGEITSAPAFTVVAKGGIDIRESVNTLYGYYITPGTVDTCSDVTAGQMTVDRCSTGPTSARGGLQIQGGMAAKTVKWKRNFGTLGNEQTTYKRTSPNNQCTAEDTFNGWRLGSPSRPPVPVLEASRNALRDCAAERVRFAPSYYVTNPFISSRDQSVSNLPISTIELPPVY